RLGLPGSLSLPQVRLVEDLTLRELRLVVPADDGDLLLLLLIEKRQRLATLGILLAQLLHGQLVRALHADALPAYPGPQHKPTRGPRDPRVGNRSGAIRRRRSGRRSSRRPAAARGSRAPSAAR